MAINSNFNSSESIKRAVQLACYGNQDRALQLLQPLGPSDVQNKKIVALFQEAKASTDALDLQRRVISILGEAENQTFPANQSALIPAAGAADDFFLQTPQDIQRTILLNLDIMNIFRCVSVCKSLNQTIKDDVFSREVFCRDFQGSFPTPTSGFFRACKDCHRAQLNFQNGVFARRAIENQKRMRAIGGDVLPYSCSDDGTINIWDLEVKNCLKTIRRDQNSTRALIFVDGTFYSGGANGTIEVFDLEKGECLLTFKGHQTLGQENCVTSLAFGDGVLYSTSFDKTIKIWDPKTGKCLNTLEGHKNKVRVLAYSDGVLCSGSTDGIIKVWDPKTGECMKTIQAHHNVITGLIFCNGLLYSSSLDGLIRAWNPKTGEYSSAMRGASGSIFSFISFNGNLCSGGSGGYVNFWKPETGKCLHSFEAKLGGISYGIPSLAWFNGKLCASSPHGGIEIWDFMEKDTVIFKELADLLRSGNDEATKEAMERFSKMPIKVKNKIYELCGIPVSMGDYELWASATVEQRADAIERYIKSQEEDNTSPSST